MVENESMKYGWWIKKKIEKRNRESGRNIEEETETN
jgi:hypothetical protein